MELAPICDESPLSNTSHFVAGVMIPECIVDGKICSFAAMYASLGVACLATVVDGDCGLDVMTMMLGSPNSFQARKDLRIEISDYLISRIGEPWLQDVLVACQELSGEDVALYRSGDTKIVANPALPAVEEPAPPTAVAEPAPPTAETLEVVDPDEDTFAAMRWASKLQDDSCVLSLMRSLPKELVNEQIILYRNYREQANNAIVVADTEKKIKICVTPRHLTRMLVAQRFHIYCHKHGIKLDGAQR